MPPSIILDLQKEFLAEATSAPKLFRDLGKVEQYIAESYKTRSFIELIQNADDANSSVFGIYSIDDMLVVANDGRPFTVHDIEALCRSGSSNKNRGGSTIGYRGIGFKSVVNLAKRIYVFSEGYKFYFDKETTSQLLPDIQEVPLIRVLHPFDETNDTLKIACQLKELTGQHGYATFFIFCDINNRIVHQELQDFDRSSLLFLNNIGQVICHADGFQRDIFVTKKYRNCQRIVEIREGAKTDNWEIISSPKDPRDMIALKIKDGTIVPASQEESVVHSFTPTIEFAGAYIKINGDFSTDPSRKNIDFDDFSQRSFINVLALLVDTIIDLLEGKSLRKGFFSPFVNVPNIEGNKFKIRFYKDISAELKNRSLLINGNRVAFSSLRLRPDWLNHEDYEKICDAGFCPVTKELLTTYPDLPIFMDLVGVTRLYLHEVMATVNNADVSVTGAAQITTKIINQYRYDMTEEKVEEITALKLFPKGNNLVTAKEIETADELKSDFVRYLSDHVEASDLKEFISKTGIEQGQTLQDKITTQPFTHNVFNQVKQSAVSSKEPAKPVFKSTPNLQKWRSAEKNALEYLKALEGVLSVIDVSTANIGYDLEIMFETGRRIFIEVKSVRSFKEPFKITNNEYSSAHNFGDSYYLAIVINEEPFQLRLVPNPIKNLSFQKQIERWSWFCESYLEHIESVEILIQSK